MISYDFGLRLMIETKSCLKSKFWFKMIGTLTGIVLYSQIKLIGLYFSVLCLESYYNIKRIFSILAKYLQIHLLILMKRGTRSKSMKKHTQLRPESLHYFFSVYFSLRLGMVLFMTPTNSRMLEVVLTKTKGFCNSCSTQIFILSWYKLQITIFKGPCKSHLILLAVFLLISILIS